jgi:hypothetical protein
MFSVYYFTSDRFAGFLQTEKSLREKKSLLLEVGNVFFFISSFPFKFTLMKIENENTNEKTLQKKDQFQSITFD